MPFSNQTERVNNQPAFILHHRSYRDSSLILEVLTRDNGRIALVAKGVRTQKSRLKGILQVFQPLVISWSRKTELGTLASAETLCPPFVLSNDALYAGLYLNEILLKLTSKDDAYPDIFSNYEIALSQLPNNNIEEILRIFEKGLLQSLGYEIDYFNDAETQTSIVNDKYYEFIPDYGFKVVSENASNVFSFLGEDVIAIGHNNFSNEKILKSAGRIMQFSIKRLLGGAELKTRDLYKAYLSSKKV